MKPLEKIYRAIKAAETGSKGFNYLRDSDGEYWCRTIASNVPGGSSAYGPVQMTGTLYTDMWNRHDAYYVSYEEVPFLNMLLEQARLFLLHGNMQGMTNYDPDFDYPRENGGGRGYLAKPEFVEEHGTTFKTMYKSLAMKAIAEHLKRVKDSEMKMLKLWRGKSFFQDPAYYYRYFSSRL